MVPGKSIIMIVLPICIWYECYHVLDALEKKTGDIECMCCVFCFQTHASPLVLGSFERNGNCITATCKFELLLIHLHAKIMCLSCVFLITFFFFIYIFQDGVFNETTLTVYNHMLISSPTGNVSDINGFAYATEEAGVLIVSFGAGVPANANC